MSEELPERRFRTLFISDVHLGARGSQADRLLDFFRTHDADTIYLVGDIVDGWALQSSWYWPQSHNDFVQKVLRKARKGAKVIYVPGNHDEFLRNYYGTHFGGIDVVENTVHVGVDGKRYLVIHGDIFDLVVQNARWLAHLGDKAYDFAIQMNRLVNFFRRAFGVPYWSLSQFLVPPAAHASIPGHPPLVPLAGVFLCLVDVVDLAATNAHRSLPAVGPAQCDPLMEGVDVPVRPASARRTWYSGPPRPGRAPGRSGTGRRALGRRAAG